jgi:hypothetical protein
MSGVVVIQARMRASSGWAASGSCAVRSTRAHCSPTPVTVATRWSCGGGGGGVVGAEMATLARRAVVTKKALRRRG